MLPRLYKVKEFASIVKRRPKTIYRWIEEESISFCRIRTGYLIPEFEVRRLSKLQKPT